MDKFPEPNSIVLDADKKEFINLFGEFLKSENILKNFDEFESFEPKLPDRLKQDMKSVYLELRDEIKASKSKLEFKNEPSVDFSDVVFEIDLLKTDEINLDYILQIIFEKAKNGDDINTLKSEIKRIIRANLGIRAKESLIINFIDGTKLDDLHGVDDILEKFYTFAKGEKAKAINELVKDEKLKDGGDEFIKRSINKGFVDEAGTSLNDIMPPVSRRGGERATKKQNILEKIRKLVDIFVGI
ncbi:MAG: hypothetical protein MR902_04465 [Campylobacter sp.]|nr:hypothetical protein [Campylobacter sp.]